jgi:hypothetical protein
MDTTLDVKAKTRTALIRGRTKKQTTETPVTPVEQSQAPPSPVYATIERDTSLDRASFATVAIDIKTQPVTASIETVSNTPKQSTFKRIQSLFRPSPSNFSNIHRSWTKNFISL